MNQDDADVASAELGAVEGDAVVRSERQLCHRRRLVTAFAQWTRAARHRGCHRRNGTCERKGSQGPSTCHLGASIRLSDGQINAWLTPNDAEDGPPRGGSPAG